MNIIYYPVFSNVTQLNDQISRASWYLYCVDEIDSITFLISFKYDINNDFHVPDYLDPEIIRFKDIIIDKIKIFNCNEYNIDEHRKQNQYCFLWDKAENLILSTIADNTVRVNKCNDRYEGSNYIQFSFDHFLEITESTISENHSKFKQMVEMVRVSEKSYIFGTGPSLANYKNYSYSDGVSIICNSIIMDDEFLDYVKPKILVFGDPIFHFGCSQYAADFRKKIFALIEKSDIFILIPLKYYYIITKNYPIIKNRVIAIPFERNIPINLNLLENYYVRAGANIFTLLMFPIATTISKEINMIGYDGRKISENEYFWSHNKKTQIVDKMDNIQICHPGFFDIEYNDYYQDHCENMLKYIEFAEHYGFEVNSLEPSYIPAVNIRNWKYQLTKRLNKNVKKRIISVNPSLKDENGHFWHYDLRLQSYINDDQVDFISLTNTDFDINETNNSIFFRIFHDKSPTNTCKTLISFVKLLNRIDSKAKNIFFMYEGRHQLIPILYSEIKKYGVFLQNNAFVVNFMYLSQYLFDDENLLNDFSDHSLKDILLNDLEYNRFNLFCSVDNSRLSEEVKKRSGKDIDNCGFFWIGDEKKINNNKTELSETNSVEHNVNLFYPGNARKHRNFNFLLHAIKKLQSEKRFNLTFTFKSVSFSDEFPVDRNLYEEIINYDNVNVLSNILSNDQYAEEFDKADIILLPYFKSYFYARTSGIVADAIMNEKVILITDDTLPGIWVKQLGIGETFLNNNIESFISALERLLDNYSIYKSKCSSGKKSWMGDNNPNKTINYLLSKLDNMTSYNDAIYKDNLLEYVEELSLINKKNDFAFIELVDQRTKIREEREKVREQRDIIRNERKVLRKTKNKIHDDNIKLLSEREKIRIEREIIRIEREKIRIEREKIRIARGK